MAGIQWNIQSSSAFQDIFIWDLNGKLLQRINLEAPTTEAIISYPNPKKQVFIFGIQQINGNVMHRQLVYWRLILCQSIYHYYDSIFLIKPIPIQTRKLTTTTYLSKSYRNSHKPTFSKWWVCEHASLWIQCPTKHRVGRPQSRIRPKPKQWTRTTTRRGRLLHRLQLQRRSSPQAI